ncbi:MAG: hypothetical protein JNL49_01290 [Bacteroidia bacterium]|nr:hypothetical protein [Bacteroidia bacterium]
MKKLLTLLILLLLSLHSKAQPYLLYQTNIQTLNVYNLSNNTWQHLSGDAYGQLVGYELSNDTLIAFLEYQGKLRTILISDPLFSSIPICKTKLNVDSLKLKWFRNYIPEYVSVSCDGKYLVYGAERYAMFNSWSKVFELNMETGQTKFIAKGKFPSYSSNDRYILYTSYYYSTPEVYDRKINKRIDLTSIKAYWLYK